MEGEESEGKGGWGTPHPKKKSGCATADRLIYTYRFTLYD